MGYRERAVLLGRLGTLLGHPRAALSGRELLERGASAASFATFRVPECNSPALPGVVGLAASTTAQVYEPVLSPPPLCIQVRR